VKRYTKHDDVAKNPRIPPLVQLNARSLDLQLTQGRTRICEKV